jgi:uncharacterized membrane protein HdeD (DUF308 family)
MISTMNSTLIGATAMASLTAALFFLRYWRQSRDSLFVMFAIAFGIDAVMRFILGVSPLSSEDEPLYYIPRLIMFALIIIAIVQKNRRRSP